jgi:hypothetical protein
MCEHFATTLTAVSPPKKRQRFTATTDFHRRIAQQAAKFRF